VPLTAGAKGCGGREAPARGAVRRRGVESRPDVDTDKTGTSGAGIIRPRWPDAAERRQPAEEAEVSNGELSGRPRWIS
jgi:hypothetical protein